MAEIELSPLVLWLRSGFSLLRASEFTNVAAGLETTVVSRVSLSRLRRLCPRTKYENLLSGYSCLVMKDLFI